MGAALLDRRGEDLVDDLGDAVAPGEEFAGHSQGRAMWPKPANSSTA
ncbi:hypothetical protein [Streptomyces europaeiscabiei]|nr:hypothetical protein [Streptomyces europaeiscabiei]MDX2768428.1 hypothetical protein [Streptomyces europaeiscabiei]